MQSVWVLTLAVPVEDDNRYAVELIVAGLADHRIDDREAVVRL